MMDILQKMWRIMHWIFFDVDKCGLDQTDRNLLMTIIERFDGGPVGLDTLAASLSEDSGTIEDVYEPYLLKNGLFREHREGGS